MTADTDSFVTSIPPPACSRKPIHEPPGPQSPSSDVSCGRLGCQDATSVSIDGDSVGPSEGPEVAEPEVSEFACAAVQEMESLARSCIFVEESYQRFFIKNCGAQKEEAVWREQGEREEAASRQAAKAISQVHLGELWARVGYYNTEAAQRSNLFRMLLAERRQLAGPDMKPPDGGKGRNPVGATSVVEKRRRRPGLGDGAVAPHGVPMAEFLQLAARVTTAPAAPAAPESNAQPSATEPKPAPPAVPTIPSRTALVHNPYSFDGPSEVTVPGITPKVQAPSFCPTTAASASNPTVSAIAALLKRLAPDSVSALPVSSPAGGSTPLPPTAPSALLEVLRSTLASCPRMKTGLPSSRASRPPSFEGPPPSPRREGVKMPLGEAAEDVETDNPSTHAPSVNDCKTSTVTEIPEAAATSAEPLCVDLNEIPQVLNASESTAVRALTHRCRRKGPPSEGGSEDHPVAAHPTCNHVKFWKRLRANRGFAYFVCYRCGAKWRTSTKARVSVVPGPSEELEAGSPVEAAAF